MAWLIFAFSGPILWAASTHIDKYLLERYFKNESVAVLMVFTSIIGVVMLPFIWFYQPTVIALSLQSMIVIAVSGILYMGAMYFYLQALQSEEASTVAPFFHATGLFGIILGYLVLGEALSRGQITGGLFIIAGSIILSLYFGHRKRKIKTRLVLTMLGCALALALSSLIFKIFAVQDEFWPTTFWNFVGQAIFSIILMAVTANRKHFFNMLRKNTAAVLSVNGVNELINLGGGLGTRYALLLAPLGIVQAISSTTSFFVLLFGVLLTLFFPKLGREELSRTTLLQKSIAIIFIVVGVILINK